MSKIKFLKIRDVKSPTRSYNFDAGIDFYVPKFDTRFIKDLLAKNIQLFEHNDTSTIINLSTLTMSSNDTNIVNYNSMDDVTKDDEKLLGFDTIKGPFLLLLPHNRVNIPSGIKCRMEEPGRALIAANKSGVATKHGIVIGACVVDYLYQGEVHLSIINTSTKIIKIFQDQKILQFIETPVINSKIEIVDGKDNGIDKNPNIYTFYDGMKTDRGSGAFGSTDNE